jgi:hypothetical protein
MAERVHIGKRLIGIGLVVVGTVLIVLSQRAIWSTKVSLGVEPTPVERLIPTAGPTLVVRETTASDYPMPTASSLPPHAARSPASVTLTSLPVPALYNTRQRIGLGVPFPPFSESMARQLNPGWYLDWEVSRDPLDLEGLEYVFVVRLKGSNYSPDLPTLAEVAAQRPGSLWLIGSEPDVMWQDNVRPDDYACLYHDLYIFLKEQDPSCRIAIGAVSQPTPLRLRYLEAILNAYQYFYGTKMPVDVWNVHAFILREEANSWGVDIPPGFPYKTGELYEIEDHDDMTIFQGQIVAFRRWMKDHGEQDKPLIVSEYGILMPENYGFPAEQVERFMVASFDYFLTARDPEIGCPEDGGRLVQRWAWFSLADTKYPTGSLMDQGTGQLTPLGEAYTQYIASHLD